MRRITGIVFCILLALIFPNTSKADFVISGGYKSVKIPIEIQNNIILVPIRINGSFEMNFILDTGVRTTILTEPMVSNFLSLDSFKSIRVRGLGEGDAIKAALAENVNIDLPGITGKGLRLIVLPEGLVSYSNMFGKPVYGIIGYAVFRQFVVEINYRKKYIRLHDPFRYKTPKKGSFVPIEVKKGKPYVKATLTDYGGFTVTTDWLIDTGASQALSLFDENLTPPEPNLETFLGKGLSGDVFGKLGRISSFEIGKFQFGEVIAGYPDASSLGMISNFSWYGNLGSEILSRFHVIFDYHRKHIILKKNNRFDEEFTYNISGIELIAKGQNFDTFIVSYVRPQSPAAMAGIKVNDIIVSIDGYSLDGHDLGEIYLNLNRKPGKKLALKIVRGDSTFKKKFNLYSEL